MVVKASSAPTSPNQENDPLRGVQHHHHQHHKSAGAGTKETEIEFGRLKSLVPAISRKQVQAEDSIVYNILQQ